MAIDYWNNAIKNIMLFIKVMDDNKKVKQKANSITGRINLQYRGTKNVEVMRLIDRLK